MIRIRMFVLRVRMFALVVRMYVIKLKLNRELAEIARLKARLA